MCHWGCFYTRTASQFSSEVSALLLLVLTFLCIPTIHNQFLNNLSVSVFLETSWVLMLHIIFQAHLLFKDNGFLITSMNCAVLHPWLIIVAICKDIHTLIQVKLSWIYFLNDSLVYQVHSWNFDLETIFSVILEHTDLEVKETWLSVLMGRVIHLQTGFLSLDFNIFKAEIIIMPLIELFWSLNKTIFSVELVSNSAKSVRQ